MAKKRVEARQLLRELKQANIDNYGGVCACCGESRVEMLTMDHIAGVPKHITKKWSDRGTALYYKLRNLNFPQGAGYQLLCMGCNWAKGVFKVCPHEIERRAQSEYGVAIAFTDKLRHQLYGPLKVSEEKEEEYKEAYLAKIKEQAKAWIPIEDAKEESKNAA